MKGDKMKQDFKLRHENYAGDLGFSGTIRTTPENYYVCSVKENGELEFRGLEVITRNLNQEEIERWWEHEKENNKLRKYRQDKANRKAERLRSWGESKLRQAQDLEDSISEYAHDWAFITQPGHIPARAKINRKQERIFQLRKEGQAQIERAERIRKYGGRIKGDAERARETMRIEQDKTIGKGSRVHDFCFGDGEVTRVNKKSYSIKFDSGGTYPRDKTYIKLI